MKRRALQRDELVDGHDLCRAGANETKGNPQRLARTDLQHSRTLQPLVCQTAIRLVPRERAIRAEDINGHVGRRMARIVRLTDLIRPQMHTPKGVLIDVVRDDEPLEVALGRRLPKRNRYRRAAYGDRENDESLFHHGSVSTAARG